MAACKSQVPANTARAMAGEALKDRLGLGKKTRSPTKRSGMGRTLAGAERAHACPQPGAQAVAGCSTAFVNPGWGRAAEQMRQQKVEGEGAAGRKGRNGCPSISGGSNCRMREKRGLMCPGCPSQ